MAKKPTYDELEKRVQELERDDSKHNRLEESLQQSKVLLDATQQLTKAGGWEWDVEEKTMFWTDETYKIHDFQPNEFPQGSTKHIDQGIECYDLEDRPVIMGAFKNCIEKGQPYDLEFPFNTLKGRRIWIRTMAEAVRKNGKIVKVVGNIMDISDRKQTESVIRKSKERLADTNQLLEGVLKHTHMLAAFLDFRFNFIWVNQAYAVADDREPSFFLGKNHFDLYPDEENQAIFQRVVDTGEKFFVAARKFEYPAHPERGVTYWDWSLIPVKDDIGNVTRVVLTLAEVTKRIRAEEELIESKERFKTLSNLTFEGILIHNNGVVIDSNHALTRIAGYTRKEMIGENIIQLCIPQEYHALIKENMAKNLAKPYELMAKRKDGTVFPVEVEARDIKYKNKKFRVAAIRDITERKQAEEEKIKAQKIAGEHKKLALVGQIAGKMAHDFNNILGIIMGNTELALLDCKYAETRKTLELIFEQTLRGKNLTRNLVAFAKDQEPKQEFFRISEKIELVANLLKKDLEGIDLIKEDKIGIPELLADPGMIEHALVNLIQNSIHATSMSEHPRIIIRTYCLDNNICLEVEDNGCGIPEESLDNIYEPSFTLKGTKDMSGSYGSGIKGTGYGMANVRKYIKQHKGNISVESEFRSGTKFTISLPVINKELTSEEKTEIREEIVHFDKSILLVEDEPAISGVQYRILSQEPCNHKVDIAHDGQVAMDLFKRNEYDLISLDYLLPGGINGMDVYDHVRKTNKTIPILFISGNIEFLESIKDLKQKDDNIDHLSKPCQNKDYINGINKLLEITSTVQE